MKKALHLYVCKFKKNSGDFLLGPSTKYHFEQMISKDIQWSNFDIRKTVNIKDIEYFNKFDYIVVGGGGLLLPDSNRNNISCWQWPISADLISKIKVPMYVLSIGLNWFFGQNAAMPVNDSLEQNKKRIPIFKKNIETLIDKSSHISIRHKGDISQLNSFVNLKNKNKIKFEFCPVINYVKSKYKKEPEGDLFCFELKDDRPKMRYVGTSREDIYSKLFSFIKILEKNNKKIGIMSHDGSTSFKRYVDKQGFKNYVFLDNSVANEKKIIENYRRVKKLYCSAGHSQMISYALGIDSYTLISHPKLKYFIQDIGKSIPKDGNFVKDISIEGLVSSSGLSGRYL
jgi:hypothetical protein